MSGLAEDSHLQSNKKLPVIRGELALITVILINSLGVVLMLYSGSVFRQYQVCRMLSRKYFHMLHLEPGLIFSRDF